MEFGSAVYMKKVILIIILALAAFFRLYQISSLPIGLFGDEIDVGYQSWSLSKTGKDYMGNTFPTYIRSFSEWRAPLVMYLTAPFVRLLGPSTLSVRLPIALLGVASVWLLYLTLKVANYGEKSSLVSAFLLALAPWHIHYSRASFEVVPLLFLFLLGLYLYIKKEYLLSLIPFILTFYTYSTAVVFVPLSLLGLVLFYPPKVLSFKPKNIFLIILVFILIIPVFKNIIFGNASNRFQSLSILGSSKVADQVVLSRIEPWVNNQSVDRIFNNKVIAITKTFVENYLSAFSPVFLFAKGDPYFRHSSGFSGEFLPVYALFFIFGLFYLFTNVSDKKNQFLLWLLVVSPVASSLTVGGGDHATRLFVMVLPLVAICSLSVNLINKSLLSKTILSIGLLTTVVTFSIYWYNYTAHYRYQSAGFWNYGYQQAFTNLAKIEGGFSKIYINNTYQPSLLPFLFYTKFIPSEFHKKFVTDNQSSYSYGGFTGFSLADRYYFGQVSTLENFQSLLDSQTLYLAVQSKEVPGDWDWTKNPPAWAKVLDTVFDTYGKPLFYLVTGTK